MNNLTSSASSVDLTAKIDLEPQLAQKLVKLKDIFAQAQRVLIAYSGGIDSTLVAKIAHDVLAENALAVTAESPSLLPADLEDAKIQAQAIGITHKIVQTAELDNPEYAANPINRCYFCKSELHETLRPLANSLGYDYVIDGVNADDLKDYRPGIQAAKERGARSPLAEVGISKLEVRMLSRYLGLPWWDKPSQPCLSSRFPYGEAITKEKLERVGKAEFFLRNLLRDRLQDTDWKGDLRVRSIADMAKIELPRSQISAFIDRVDLVALTEQFKCFGFLDITLDLEGFRSGKLNDVLKQK
ncbi:hypothetical protein Pse7367_0760 [Thalassoporum mexicanum PCC 7367]|uniref:ATP-dependent sacrificial sulfur transferase LarE n=1 Tax=Thalassoporum mexicanum TaxID=3457544 RepID=UPI00029FB598|nr:ATP-dependent sacrificial sulfur transferase LarE [Pseudanabaena sp. PCC 7367]AFY69061.1 hypothetical protein Pse7367_0760 [Pseudanabaena sp. PCC 7367]